MKALKQRLDAILAEADGTRWDVLATRVCGGLGLLASAGLYAHLIPGKPGAVVAGASAVAAALLPRATKAAGLLSVAYGQKTPLIKILPQLVATLLAAPKITADAKADQQAQAEAEAQKMVEQKIDQAVEQKMADLKITNLTMEDLKNLTGQFARTDLAEKVPDTLGEKVPVGPEAAEEPETAPETAVEAETTLSTPGPEPAIPGNSIAVTGGNQ